ncbi:MAG TPA: hypothetical protein VHH34_24140 [Pseudonocardiaceae bacterium]|nr:hypothetical protein [Pseudonocardiaceae bacterium]
MTVIDPSVPHRYSDHPYSSNQHRVIALDAGPFFDVPEGCSCLLHVAVSPKYLVIGSGSLLRVGLASPGTDIPKLGHPYCLFCVDDHAAPTHCGDCGAPEPATDRPGFYYCPPCVDRLNELAEEVRADWEADQARRRFVALPGDKS